MTWCHLLGALPEGLQKTVRRKCNGNTTHILKWAWDCHGPGQGCSCHQSEDTLWAFGELTRLQGSVFEASPAFKSSFPPTPRSQHILPASNQTLSFNTNDTNGLKTPPLSNARDPGHREEPCSPASLGSRLPPPRSGLVSLASGFQQCLSPEDLQLLGRKVENSSEKPSSALGHCFFS